MSKGVALAAAVLVAVISRGTSSAAVTWPQPTLVRYASGFTQPTVITNAGDGSGRLFVVERGGRIRIVQNGVVTGTLLDVSSKVMTSGSEQGLLGLAFPPGYASKGYYYVDYTRRPDGATVISRFTNGGGEEVLLTIAQPFANHNGGQLQFGPDDGYLYIGMGDGGSAGDPGNRAQNPQELLGKILRIDVESGARP